MDPKHGVCGPTIKLTLYSPNKIFLCASEFKMFAKTEYIKVESCRNIHKKLTGVTHENRRLASHGSQVHTVRNWSVPQQRHRFWDRGVSNWVVKLQRDCCLTRGCFPSREHFEPHKIAPIIIAAIKCTLSCSRRKTSWIFFYNKTAELDILASFFQIRAAYCIDVDMIIFGFSVTNKYAPYTHTHTFSKRL